ncbi:MAG: phage major capsid protein [Tepidisphaeraceae bacterium]
MPDINALRNQFNTVHTEATAFEDRYAAAGAGEPTAEETQAQADRMTQLEKLTKQIENAGKLATYAANNAGVTVTARNEAGESIGTGTAVAVRKSADQIAVEHAAEVAGQPKEFDRHEFGVAVTQWALTGVMAEEYATITTATASGILYPKQVAVPVNATAGSALQEAMAAAGVVPMNTATTADLNIPVVEMPVGSDVSETATAGTDNSPTPTAINLKPVVTQSGQVWVSNLELQANDFDLLAELDPSLDDAVEVRLEQRAVAAMIADTANITQVVRTATASGLTYDNLVDLNRKLSRRYDRNKVILLSDTAYALAEKLVGSDGHPVLNRDPQNQQLLRFNGTPVIRSTYFQAFGAINRFVGCIMSFVGVRVRYAGSAKLVRHTDDKDKIDQTGVNKIKYTAFGYVPNAVAMLETPAS